LKNNKSLRTVALWVFLIVIFIMIYQTVSKSGAGKPVQFSDFINNALPPSYVQNSTPPPMGVVTVYQTGPNAADAIIEYSVNRTDDGRAATAEELAKSRREFYTRGDVRIPLGLAEGGQTLNNALSDRRDAWTFRKAPDPTRGWTVGGVGRRLARRIGRGRLPRAAGLDLFQPAQDHHLWRLERGATQHRGPDGPGLK